MKKVALRRNRFLLVLLPIIIVILVIANCRSKNYRNIEDNYGHKDNLAIYVEDETGMFIHSESIKFPTEGYILDLENSVCENGEELTQDIETKKISLSLNHKTKCSLYFKKEAELSNVEILLAKANSENITDHESGNYKEMYAFRHEATAQTEALIDYRYIGEKPNNYITFNDELWRIIGVFTVEGEKGVKEQRIKIIRDKSIGNLAWDSNNINEWPTSSLVTLLNEGDYYKKSGDYNLIGLTEKAKTQIALTKWYLGGSTDILHPSQTFYNLERGNTVYNERSTNMIAKIGLMYPSDYLYSYPDVIDTTSWLFNYALQWTITPQSLYPSGAFYIHTSHSIQNANVSSSSNIGVRPCVYLRSNIEIISGIGTESDPYILK